MSRIKGYFAASAFFVRADSEMVHITKASRRNRKVQSLMQGCPDYVTKITEYFTQAINEDTTTHAIGGICIAVVLLSVLPHLHLRSA